MFSTTKRTGDDATRHPINAEKKNANGTHQQLVVHGLHNDFLRRVLGDIESELQHFAVTFVLDERAVQAIEPGRIMLGAQRTAVLSALRRSAERYNTTNRPLSVTFFVTVTFITVQS